MARRSFERWAFGPRAGRRPARPSACCASGARYAGRSVAGKAKSSLPALRCAPGAPNDVRNALRSLSCAFGAQSSGDALDNPTRR